MKRLLYHAHIATINSQERQSVERRRQLPVDARPRLVVDSPFQNENNGVQHAVVGYELFQFAVATQPVPIVTSDSRSISKTATNSGTLPEVTIYLPNKR